MTYLTKSISTNSPFCRNSFRYFGAKSSRIFTTWPNKNTKVWKNNTYRNHYP